VDLFDLSRLNRASPQNLACAPIDAHRDEFLARLIELRQENTLPPNDGRRQS